MGGLSQIPVDYVLDALLIHIAGSDQMGQFLEANDVACERLGYTRAELLRMSPKDLHSKTNKVDTRSYTARLAAGQSVLFEQIHVAKNGKEIPVEIHARPILWEGQKAIVSMARDITFRKRVEKDLRTSEENFRLAFDHALVGQVMVCPQGCFLQVNYTFAKMLGYSPVDLLGKRLSDLTHPDDMSQTDELFRAMLKEGVPFYRITKRYLHRDGHVVWGEVSTVLLRNLDGT
ncbi:MAG: PAS domain S-box protein, partial [bacterium]